MSIPQITLKSFDDIPDPYRSVFSSYHCLNQIQSAVYDDIFNSTESIVVTAPTGSGKTVLFELALVRLILDTPDHQSFKAVYIAPVKALCNERFQDWNERFGALGISCVEVTGDSLEKLDLRGEQIILTTPEKWDSVTRRWRDNRAMVQEVGLVMLDEVHLVRDPRRGPVLETVVCRMKTIARALRVEASLRFVAVSATIFNIEDIAAWLGGKKTPAKFYRFGNEMRPVTLKRIVRGYSQWKGQSSFLFDIQLSYKIKPILMDHAHGKPVLVFCSTRKGVVQTSQVLLNQLSFEFSPEQQHILQMTASRVSDGKLREGLMLGVGYHHAGVTAEDRTIVQDIFVQGALPVLVSTSTLAMGVNLPAHLVIIKSTHQYVAGRVEEYSESTMLQMVGRAGRPQFDATGTVVIMTRCEMVHRYETLLDCREVLESSLHLHLPEQLNAEIVLFTITDLSVAMDWLRCTFLYQRAIANPKHYGFAAGDVQKIEKDLETLVLRDINALKKLELVKLNNNGMDITPTVNGRLMSHYYINLSTFRLFSDVGAHATIRDLLTVLSNAEELNDVQLRMSERRILNELNASTKQETIRFPMSGKITTRASKINCLVQASLGCLPIPDPGLQQEARRAVAILDRVTKCLAELTAHNNQYNTLLSATMLAKCLRAKLWENSLFVSKQLDRIGNSLGASLVAFGKTSFSALLMTHPHELERILNRAPPAGNVILDQVRHLPRYAIQVDVRGGFVSVVVSLANAIDVETRSTTGPYHAITLLVGDSTNRVLHQRQIIDNSLFTSDMNISVALPSVRPQRVYVHIISNQWVGLDVYQDILVDPMAKFEVGLNCHVGQTMAKTDSSKRSTKTEQRKKANADKTAVDNCSQSISIHFTKPVANGKTTKPVKPKIPKKPPVAKIQPPTPVIECCFDIEPDWEDFLAEEHSDVQNWNCNQPLVADTNAPIEGDYKKFNEFGSSRIILESSEHIGNHLEENGFLISTPKPSLQEDISPQHYHPSVGDEDTPRDYQYMQHGSVEGVGEVAVGESNRDFDYSNYSQSESVNLLNEQYFNQMGDDEGEEVFDRCDPAIAREEKDIPNESVSLDCSPQDPEEYSVDYATNSEASVFDLRTSCDRNQAEYPKPVPCISDRDFVTHHRPDYGNTWNSSPLQSLNFDPPSHVQSVPNSSFDNSFPMKQVRYPPYPPAHQILDFLRADALRKPSTVENKENSSRTLEEYLRLAQRAKRRDLAQKVPYGTWRGVE